MAATYGVYVDWNDDGDFSDVGEHVTARTLARTDLHARYGRDQARALSPTAPGEAGFELDNRSKDYSPDNSSSPLAGQVLPGRGVYIKATLLGVDYTLFRGHLDDFVVRPEIGLRSIGVTCLDPLARLKGLRVSTGLYGAVRTGAAIGLLLDAAGWDESLRDLDAGATTAPWFWLDDADAYATLMELVDSEGPGALVTVDGNGAIVFRDRHHRLLNAASTTLQTTFSDTGAEPLFSDPMSYDHGWKEIVNTISFQVPIRQPSGNLSTVWSSQDQRSISDGQTILLLAKGTTPFIGAVIPEAGTDFTLLSGAVTVTLSRTSGAGSTIFIQATGGPAAVSNVQLRAYALETTSTVQINAEETVSIGKYGHRSPPAARDPVWASVYDVAAIADLILGQRAERLPTVTITVKGTNDTRLLQQLTRDLSDRVHVVEAETSLDHDFFVEQIAHTLTDQGMSHITTFGLEKIPEAVADVFMFDVSGRGFNDGKFGAIGRDDPASMFIFDVAGQGFDDGLFAH